MRETKIPIRLARQISWQVTAGKKRLQDKYAGSKNEIYRMEYSCTGLPTGFGSGEMGSDDETGH